MVLRWISALTPQIKPNLVQIKHIIESLETKAQVTSYKNVFVHIKQGKEENLMGTKPPLKNGHGEKYGSEYNPSPCVTHSKKGSHIGECILYEALREDVSNLLRRWAIVQRHHLLIHQAPDEVHVYLYDLGPMFL